MFFSNSFCFQIVSIHSRSLLWIKLSFPKTVKLFFSIHLYIHCRSAAKKRFHDLQMTGLCSKMKRSEAFRIYGLNICASLNQKIDNLAGNSQLFMCSLEAC